MKARISWRRLGWRLIAKPTTWQDAELRETLEIQFQAGSQVLSAEAAPLPGLHPETISDCIRLMPELLRLFPWAEAAGSMSTSRLNELLLKKAVDPLWQKLPASLRFAAEAALWGEKSRYPGSTPATCKLLSGNPETWLQQLDENSSCCKVKLGRGDLIRECAGLKTLQAHESGKLEIRLDANARWSLKDLRWAQAQLADPGPVWIEDPLADPEELQRWLADWKEGRDWPLALDLTEAESPDWQGENTALKALVLKPQVLALSGIYRVLEELPSSVTPVLSSCFESSLSLSLYQDLARGPFTTAAPGIDTFRFLEDKACDTGEWHVLGK